MCDFSIGVPREGKGESMVMTAIAAILQPVILTTVGVIVFVILFGE